MNKEDWYRLRNDRTNRIDEVFLNDNSKRVGVRLFETSLKANQLASIIFLNTLCRWCRRISVEIYSTSSKGSEIIFKGELESIIKEADLYIDLEFETVNSENCDFIVEIGSSKLSDSNVFWLDFNGWIAGFGCGIKTYNLSQNREDNNILGAAFAAAALNSEIFALYLNLKKLEVFESFHSMFDFRNDSSPNNLINPTINSAINLGRLQQIGCGAVGSNFDYLLSIMNLKTEIDLVDFDTVDISNTSSSLLYSSKDVLEEIEVKKVDRCYELLDSCSNILPHKTNGDYGDFIDKKNKMDVSERTYPDAILCFANERNVWSSIQYNEPPIVLASTTSSNWGVNFFRHIPFFERCIVCTFGTKPHQFKPICSQGVEVTDKGEEEKLGSLPFLSLTAAVLVLAELMKLSFVDKNEYPVNANFSQIVFKFIKDAEFKSLQINKSSECSVCKYQNEYNYREDFKKSLYYEKLY